MFACQRYISKSVSYTEVPLVASAIGSAHYDASRTTAAMYNGRYFLPREMRTTPTISVYSHSTGATSVAYDYIAGSNKRVIAADVTTKNFLAYSDTSALTIGNTYYLKWFADARI